MTDLEEAPNQDLSYTTDGVYEEPLVTHYTDVPGAAPFSAPFQAAQFRLSIAPCGTERGMTLQQAATTALHTHYLHAASNQHRLHIHLRQRRPVNWG
ncbi:MAG: hypothetical protein AAFS07_18720 [Pseudomonadota bacterium]